MSWLRPDLIIGGTENPYMIRWVLFRFRGWQIALHKICRSDDDRALHDHVGWNISIVLRNRYTEIQRQYWPFTFGGMLPPEWKRDFAGRWYRDLTLCRRRWWPYYRPAGIPHRLVLWQGPVWSLWIRGPKTREWGFHCPKGWVHWTLFTSGGKDGVSAIGRGCS